MLLFISFSVQIFRRWGLVDFSSPLLWSLVFQQSNDFKNTKKLSSDIIIVLVHFVLYSLISTRQLHIFSIKPKLDMQLFVDFYVFTRFWLNLSDRNLKLFWTSKQNNFRFRSRKFSQKGVKMWSCLIFF